MNEKDTNKDTALNVFGDKLKICSCHPKTGWFRDGFCNFDKNDIGKHTICCVMDVNFLNYSKSQGNDLTTPIPEYDFPGLVDGDQWCICLERWKEAYLDGLAPYVVLESTNFVVLESISIETLKEFEYKKK